MLAHDEFVRNVIADMIRSAADETLTKQLGRGAQEAAISARIAERIEATMQGLHVNGYRVEVVSADIPDRAPGALEKQTGVDLFLAIRVRSEDDVINVSKGILIQGKSEGDGGRAIERERLLGQCRKMADRSTKGAYVWVYGSAGVRSVPATEVLRFPRSRVEALSSRNVAEQFRDILDCVAGDEKLANDKIFESAEALGAWIRDYGAKAGAAIDVIGPPIFL